MSAKALRFHAASILTAQCRRSLRICRRAQALHRADVLADRVEPRGWSAISNVARAEYRLRAEQERIVPAPQFPRDAVIGRDQVTRRDRARVVAFGGARV